MFDWTDFENHAKEWTDYVKGLEEENNQLRAGIEEREVIKALFFHKDCDAKKLKETIMDILGEEKPYGYELRICIHEPRGFYEEQREGRRRGRPKRI